MKIGIVILATNKYFLLGIRLMKKFIQYYKGECEIVFYFFSDTDPKDYVPSSLNIKYYNIITNNWVEGVHQKFVSIMSLTDEDCDYLYYIDSDTNIIAPFTEKWFIGETVGAQHFLDMNIMKDEKNYERNSISKAYIPYNTKLPQMYYQGAFFGGKKNKMIEICKILWEWEQTDKKIDYEPGVNDESYLNKYFHYTPPEKSIIITDFEFIISDKGSISEIRDSKCNHLNRKKEMLKLYKNDNIDIINGEIVKK